MKKVVAVIPAYNAERTIGEIVKATQKYVDDVIVVDNDSTDSTDIMARKSKAWVIRERVKGQGVATRRGIALALERFGADIIVTLDSDGQHDPSEIPQVIKPILEGKADMVIGARFINRYKIRRYRKFGIDIINWLYNICNGKKLNDTQSCFRAYTKELAVRLIIEEDGFGFSTEVLIKIRKMKARMVEVPISCIYHNLGQDSTMNPLKHGIKVAWKTIWWRIKLWS